MGVGPEQAADARLGAVDVGRGHADEVGAKAPDVLVDAAENGGLENMVGGHPGPISARHTS